MFYHGKKTNALPNTSSSNKATRICEFVYVICRKEEIKTFKSNKKYSSQRDSGQMMYKPFTNFIEARNNDGSNPYNKATFSIEFVQKLIELYVGGGYCLRPFHGNWNDRCCLQEDGYRLHRKRTFTESSVFCY